MGGGGGNMVTVRSPVVDPPRAARLIKIPFESVDRVTVRTHGDALGDDAGNRHGICLLGRWIVLEPKAFGTLGSKPGEVSLTADELHNVALRRHGDLVDAM